MTEHDEYEEDGKSFIAADDSSDSGSAGSEDDDGAPPQLAVSPHFIQSVVDVLCSMCHVSLRACFSQSNRSMVSCASTYIFCKLSYDGAGIMALLAGI